MNDKIVEQLKKCKTTIPDYITTDLELVIPKLVNLVQTEKYTENFIVGYQYLIRVNKSLVYPCDWYYTIHNNWNQGIGPTEDMLTITVMQKMGKMMKVSSLGYNNRQSWVGWLPQTNVTLIKQV